MAQVGSGGEVSNGERRDCRGQANDIGHNFLAREQMLKH
jgi:hypothetical protein